MKQEVDLTLELPHDEQYHFTNSADVIDEAIRTLIQHCHARSYNAGWWIDPVTGEELIPPHITGFENQIREAYRPYVYATKIALIHSEASEMLETIRTDADDDKLPQFKGVTVEAADVVIRIMDHIGMLTMLTNGAYEYNLGAAILAKLTVNASRADHSIAKRLEPGGKKF